MPSQQVTTVPAPIEGVERTNMIVVWRLGMGVPPRRNPYAIEID